MLNSYEVNGNNKQSSNHKKESIEEYMTYPKSEIYEEEFVFRLIALIKDYEKQLEIKESDI